MEKNLPPGCSTWDIPGERPEDVAWERLWDDVDKLTDIHGWDAATTREIWEAGVRAKLSLGKPINGLSTEGCSLVCEVYLKADSMAKCLDAGCPNCGTSIGPEADAARAEDEAIQAEYLSTGGE